MNGLWSLTRQPINSSGPTLPGDTIPTLFFNAVKARGDKVWMRQKHLGVWRQWSWNQSAQAVREIATGLVALGLQPGQTASILSNTVVEWVWCDLAIQSARGVCNGIYPTDSVNQVEYLCADSSTQVLFVEDEEQLDKALEARQRLGKLRWIVVFDTDGLSSFHDPQVISLHRLREMGREYSTAHPTAFDHLLSGCEPKDLALLVYTSGTTGKPKGAMHIQGTLIATVRILAQSFPQNENDERMCFLPLCHIVERMLGVIVSIYSGCVLNFVENPDTVPDNVREISPTILFAVPRVWEKFYSAVVIALKESTRLQQLAYAWSIATGAAVVDCVLAGHPVPIILKLRFFLARFLALNNVRKIIGIHRARYLFTGAAPIAPDLIRWYMALGIPMLEGWGMTETTGLGAFNLPNNIRPGTIGKPIEGVQLRIDPQTGEIQVLGPSIFAGYLNLPEKTAETFTADGWLRTGDVGTQDADGYFRITDRMKDIIITAGGKNITPSEWENELKFSPYITDAVVVGDQRPYLVAIVMLDLDNIERYAQEHDIPFSNYASLVAAPEINHLIQTEFDKINKKFARVEQVKKFWLLDRQLTAEDEELTPTMKLKRKLIQNKYATQIDAMYRAD